MNELFKGAVFFSYFLPSFSRIGYQSRRWMWDSRTYDFTGQRWLVTGASDGIGREIARQAAAHGAEVHAVGRNAEKLNDLNALPGAWTTYATDLSLMSSVQEFANQLTDQKLKFDVLVNNVGLMLNEKTVTDEQLEASFATNVLSHFVLTEQLRAAEALETGTIINMSSGGMYNVPLTIDRLQGGTKYDGMLTYAYQKRAQVVLNQWWRQQGLASYVMHPGWVNTAGVRTAMPDFHKVTGPLLRELSAGADTALWLAATRPQQGDESKIWFDRAARSPHIFADTRVGASTETLVEYLKAQLTAASNRLLAA